MAPENSNSNDLNPLIRRDIERRPRDLLTIGYIRISPANGDSQEQADQIHAHADYHGWKLCGMVHETVSCMKSWKNRKELQWLAEDLQSGDRLVVNELSSLGRSVTDVASLLAKLHEKGVSVCEIKNRWQIDHTISSQMIAMFYAISHQIDRGLTSMRTREGLAIRKAKGLRLGRKKGGPAHSKLDSYKEEIISLLKSGSTKAYIMKKFETSKTNLYHWLKKNGLEDLSPEFDGSSI